MGIDFEKGQKGQGAMEYLMSYGWAILIILVVGVVLWQLNVFNLGGSTLSTSGFATLRPQLAACGLSADGTFNCILTNTLGVKISNITGTIHVIGRGTCNVTSENEVVSSGSNFIVTEYCPPGADLSGESASEGQPYEADVTIIYTVTLGSQTSTHSSCGTIRGALEGGGERLVKIIPGYLEEAHPAG